MDDPATPRDPFVPTPRIGKQDTGLRFRASDTTTLGTFGLVLQLGCGWGVSMSSGVMALDFAGAEYGTSSTTFEQVVDAVADAAGASTSWNNVTHVITFTED